MIGRNLFAGRPEIGSIWLTFCHTYHPIQPGYLWMVGMFSSAFGGDIFGARLLNTFIALGISLFIFLLGRAKFGILPAWFGALIFLTFSQSVIHFRWVYPHNAVALGFTVSVLFLLRPNRPENDWRAGFGLALATISHPLFVHGALAAALCRIKRPSALIRLAIPPTIALLITLAAIQIYYQPANWLLEDIAALAKFYIGSDGHSVQHAGLLGTFYRFYTQDLFHFLTLLCFILCFRRSYYPIAIFGFLISVLLLQNRQNLQVFYYQAIVLAPLFAMAWAVMLRTVGIFLRRNILTRRLDKFLRYAVFALPLALALAQVPAVVQAQLLPKNFPWVTQDVTEVEFAARWLNLNAQPDDLIVANSNIAWLLKSKNVDFLQAVVWKGLPTTYFADGLPRERFQFAADLELAKFVVIGDIDWAWTFYQMNVDTLLKQLSREKWKIVWQGNHYLILRNPRFSDDRDEAQIPALQ
jgi:4-amino-4-deoxy-L-arabinose transferase-like glycosyltransferase